MNDNTQFRYDAFISYRHTEPDKSIAEKLHRMLETYRIPGSIAKKAGRRKIGRVFRDRDELPTSSDLANNIGDALKSSEYLIVICSPRTPLSQWVIKEIETFSALYGHDRILALLIEGEPYESFPEPLRYVKKAVVNGDGTTSEQVAEIEPLAADIRSDSLSGMKKKMKVEILRLLAPILNCRFDDLRQRHRERAVKRIIAFSISFSLFFLAFGSFSAYQALQIKQQSQKTLMGQSLYMANISAQLLSEGDRRTAIMVAREALPADLAHPERPYVAEAEYALSQALGVYKYDNRIVPDIALKHDKKVNFIKLSSDGKTAVSAAQDGYLYIWDTEYGELKNKYYINEKYLKKDALYFTDEHTIVFLEGDGVACLDAGSMTEKWQFQCYSSHLAVNPGKGISAVADSDNVIMLDNADGKELFRYPIKDYLAGDGFVAVNSISTDDTGRYLSIGITNGSALLFDTEKKILLGTFASFYPNVVDVAVSGNYIAIASSDFDMNTADLFSKGKGALDLYDYSGKKLIERQFDYSWINNLKFGPNDENRLYFTESEKIEVLNIDDNNIDYTFINGDDVTDYRVMDGFVISSSYDGTIRFWMLDNEGYEYPYNRIVMSRGIMNFDNSSGVMVSSLQDSDKAIILRNLQNKSILALAGANSPISGCDFSPDGKTLLTYSYSSDAGEIILWDWDKKEIKKSIGLESGIKFVSFIDNGSKIFVMDSNNLLSVYNSDTLEPGTGKTAESDIFYALSPDRSLCAALASGKLHIIRTSDLATVSEIDTDSADKVIFSGDNKKVILLSKFSPSAVYDAATGELVSELQKEGISEAALSNDGELLACIYGDNSVHIMDANNYKDISEIESPGMVAVKLLFAPDGKTLFVGLDDGSVRRYDPQTGELRAELQLSKNLDGIFFNSDQSLFITRDESGEAILWLSASNRKLGRIDYMTIVSPDFKAVLTPHNSDLMVLPVCNTEMLADEAQKQLGGRTLSQKEREELYIIK